MLKYSREIKKFGPKPDLKTLENAIQLKSLDFINSNMSFPTTTKLGTEPEFRNLSMESRNLLIEKIIKSNYLNQDLLRKVGLEKLDLICGSKLTLDRLDFERYKGKNNLLVHALKSRAPEFVNELSKKAKINPFLLLESRINNNQPVELQFGSEFHIDLKNIDNSSFDDFDNYSLSKLQIYGLFQAQGANKGDLQVVEKYHHQLKQDPKFQLNSYTNLIKCFAKRQLNGGTEETYRTIKNGNLQTSSTMFQYLIQASTLSKAVNYFHEPKYKSIGMYSAMVEKYFKNNEPILAYKLVKKAINDGRRNKQSKNVHIPSEIIKLILQDLKGKKHLDYFRDMFKLAEFGNLLPTLVSKLIMESSDPELGKILYNEFTNGCCKGLSAPIAAHLGAIKQLGQLDIKQARVIFDQFIDVSMKREHDFYNEMLQAYANQNMKPEFEQLLQDMQKHGLKCILQTYESMLRVELECKEELFEKMIVPTKQYPLIFEAMKNEIVSPKYL